MKLHSFRVQSFRSVVDSGRVTVDDVTALIGPNEAGKSSLIQGLASISMDEAYSDFDLTQLESVAKRNMDGDLKSSEIEIVKANFILGPTDKEELASIAKSAGIETTAKPESIQEASTHNESDPGTKPKTAFSPPDNLDIRKFYDGFYKIDVNGTQIRFPSRAAMSRARKKVDNELKSLSKKASTEFLTRHPNNSYPTQFSDALKQASEATTTRREEGDSVIQRLQGLLALPYDDEFKKHIQWVTTRIKRIVENGFLNNDLEVKAYEYVLRRMPKTVYFRIYERMEDEVPIKELRERPEKHRTFVNFLTLAEINLETIERLVSDEETSKIPVYLENGCGKATRLLREAWPQELLDVELRYTDGRLQVFTKNAGAVETLLPPSSGSEGFQWYFGFYINFGAATKAEYRNAILLLDDPGVFLHPTAHKQLLQLFEKYLDNDVTTIYTTHLPFLIPRDKLNRLRLVEKEGAKSNIHSKFWATSDKDVLYPLRAALGVTLADSLHVGAMTIVAEGPSDRILLMGLLRYFAERGIRKIRNLEDIEVLSGKAARGAIDDAVLLQIERLPYVLILDNDKEGNNARKQALETGIPDGRIVTLPLLAGSEASQKEFDIEDMFPIEIYSKAFYAVHGKPMNLKEEDVRSKFGAGNEKINNKAKALLKGSNYELDKVAVAKELVKITRAEVNMNSTTEKRFGALFDIVNKAITLYD